MAARSTFWTPEMLDEAIKMWIRGRTSYQIARKLGTTRNAVLGKLHRHNIKARHRIGSKGEEEIPKPPPEPIPVVREIRPGMCGTCAKNVAVRNGECRDCRLGKMPERTRETVIGGRLSGASSLV